MHGRRRPAGRGASGRTLALAGALLVCALVPGCRRSSLPTEEASRFVAAFTRSDTAAMVHLLDRPPAKVAATITGFRNGAHLEAVRARVVRLRRLGGGARAVYEVHATVGGLGPWTYRSTFDLVRTRDRWRVRWAPTVLHPQLRAGLTVARRRTWPTRAPILGLGDTPLVTETPTITVGLEPDRIRDLPAVEATLQTVLAIAPATVDRALHAPGVQPGFFVPLVPLTADHLAAVRSRLEALPGVFFRASTSRVSAAPGLASHVIGRTAEVTAQRLRELGTPYEPGDTVGIGGLEGAEERTLAGAPSGDLHLVDAAGHSGVVLRSFPGAAPKAVTTTIDVHVQEAAEQALAGVGHPAALVALDAATGEIRASVSRPADQPFNRAFAGRYPPGSTGKLVTTLALLEHGMTPDTPVDCAPSAVVGGKKFTNFEGEAEGRIPLRRAFAISCNTAFVTAAATLPEGALTTAAAQLGFASTAPLPLGAAGGHFPTPSDAAEAAAEAIGQGRVTVSPLHLASMAGAIAAGAWHAPRLLAGAPGDPAPPTGVEPSVAAPMRDLMDEVVRTGTGTAAAVAGRAVAGKTGTAEFGSARPPQTHAWFAGFSGPLAFAVLVEGGGVGGRVAAPIAAAFVRAI